jgi:hypothetical protein
MNMRQVLLRSLKYFRVGASLINLPFALLGMASSFYTLVKVIEWKRVLDIFPTFEGFIYLGAPLYFITAGLFGYIYLKSKVYKSGDRDVEVLNDPMTTIRYTPLVVFFQMANLDHWKKEGVDSKIIKKMSELLEHSKSYWEERGVDFDI